MDSNGVANGFLRAPTGKFTKINYPGASNTIPENINTSGEISGLFFDSNGALHGFVRSAAGKFTKYNAPGAPAEAPAREPDRLASMA